MSEHDDTGGGPGEGPAGPEGSKAAPDDVGEDTSAVSAKDDAKPDWADAAGVSGEHVFTGDRAPGMHRALMILGPVGLALAIGASLWSSSRQITHSVNVQVESTWERGEPLGLRAQVLGADVRAVPLEVGVAAIFTDAAGGAHELGPLAPVEDGLSQLSFVVPEDVALGEGELLLSFEGGVGKDKAGQKVRYPAFEERLAISVLEQRGAARGEQVVARHMLQWADDSDEQPEGLRVDLRPEGRLLAGFHNRVFVRVTDVAGKPWAPKHVEARVQVVLISGEFGTKVGTLDESPVLYEGPLDSLGLASFVGELHSDVVRFEVRLPADVAPKPTPTEGEGEGEGETEGEEAKPEEAKPEQAKSAFDGPKRRLRFVSHAGTVRIHASTDLAKPGDTVRVDVEALSARRPVFVDVHGPSGSWLDTLTPPLRVPQERDWQLPEHFGGSVVEAGEAKAGQGFVQFEAYQSVLRPETSSAIARVQVFDGEPRDALVPLIERQREQLDLPRVDKAFEIGREKTYLSHVEKQRPSLDAGELDQARAFLIGSLEAVVHGPPQALTTRPREEEQLAAFKRRWTVGIRWFLLGGGLLFILTMVVMVWRNQTRLEAQTTAALLAEARESGKELGHLRVVSATELPEELREEQALAISHARRQVLGRGLLSVGLMVAALLLTLAMLESLVWEY